MKLPNDTIAQDSGRCLETISLTISAIYDNKHI